LLLQVIFKLTNKDRNTTEKKKMEQRS